MSKLSNVLLMLEYLQNGKKYSIKELTEKLKTHQKMIFGGGEKIEKDKII